MTDQATLLLDPEIAALCDASAGYPAAAMAQHQDALSAFTRVTAEQRYAFMAASLLVAPRVHTGYQPKAARTERAHLDYSNGFKAAPARATADDRAKAEAVKWGVAA